MRKSAVAFFAFCLAALCLPVSAHDVGVAVDAPDIRLELVLAEFPTALATADAAPAMTANERARSADAIRSDSPHVAHAKPEQLERCWRSTAAHAAEPADAAFSPLPTEYG